MPGRIGETVDLGAVVEKALLLAEHERRRLEVRVEVDRESGPPAVGADRVQIEQIPPGNVFHAVEGAERRRVSVTRTLSGRVRPVVEDSEPGAHAGAARAGLRALLHHQAERSRGRTRHRPLARRTPRRALVGGA